MSEALAQSQAKLQRRNARVAVVCLGVAAGMVGMAYAAVPLYQLFCQVTGFGGTTQRAEAVSDVVVDRVMKVRFDANTAGNLAWNFKPVQVEMSLKIGEPGLAFYEAVNEGKQAVTGTATFNVTPAKAGIYFNKVECFCFTEQTLEPGQSVNMPVSYFIDPAIAEDKDLKSLKTITLSYTFFSIDEEDDSPAPEAQRSSNLLDGTDINVN